jgi:hypothetical protein
MSTAIRPPAKDETPLSPDETEILERILEHGTNHPYEPMNGGFEQQLADTFISLI